MKHKLILLLSLCCAGAVMVPAFAAETPQQIAAKKAEAEKKAKAEAEKKAKEEARKKAEAEKKAKAEAERKAREEARANANEANKLAGEFREAVKAQKFEEAAAIAKKAHDLFGKPGVPGLDWYVKNFTAFDFVKAKPENRQKAFPVIAENWRFFIPKATGDKRVDMMNAYIAVLALNKDAAKELVQVKADRYKVEGISKALLLKLYVADNEFAKADSVAELLLKEVKPEDIDKAYLGIIAGYTSQGIFSCEAAKKWWDRYYTVPATGDAKYRKLDAYANFLETYALASMEEVDKIRAERDAVKDLTPAFKFDIALKKLSNGDTDEVYQKNLKAALDAAGKDPVLRMKVYTATTASGWNAHSNIPDNKMLVAFLKDVVLKDTDTMNVKDRWGNQPNLAAMLNAYANANYANFKETEDFIKNYPTADKGAVRSALITLYKKCGQRYYHGMDESMSRKIMALYQEELYLVLADVAKNPREMYRANNLRKQVIEWALACNDRKVIEENLHALAIQEKPDQTYIDIVKAQLAYRDGDYATVIALVKPMADAQQRPQGIPAEIFVRSLMATGDIENAAMYMEKMFGNFPYWTQRNYYRARLDSLKARAAELKKAREAKEAKQ